MKHLTNVSVQHISWVKSNKSILNPIKGIKNLYYPDTIEELENLLRHFNSSQSEYLVIGYSSNTLFLPSFEIENVICTIKLDNYSETEKYIICECGVNVSRLSNSMVERGFVGFEGLVDLPGTIASGVYGNCGCRGCSINAIVDHFTFLTQDNQLIELTTKELNLSHRTSDLKRGKLKGVILNVWLRKKSGNVKDLKAIAESNRQIRKKRQPSAVNNLGTTIAGMARPTLLGYIYKIVNKFIKFIFDIDSSEKLFHLFMRVSGKSNVLKYLFNKRRYMFLDEESHILFPKYIAFLKSLYKDVQIEIEIRK